MNKKYDFDKVKDYFINNGCKLVSTEYINTKQKLKYICNCGRQTETSFEQFKKGVRCIPCGIKKGTGNRKHKIDEVRKIFSDNNCVLISDKFENVKEPLDYVCSCGNPSVITLDSFKQGHRCYECGRKKQIESQKHDYLYVKEYFTSHGCSLISEEYVRYHDKLEYFCECGSESMITFSDFVQGKRCWDCGRRKLADSNRLTYDFVFNFFKENNCTLLSEKYENAHQILGYICDCGNTSKIKFDKFKVGQRCEECGNRKISERKIGIPLIANRGINNPNYNPLKTDEEREIQRNFPAYRDWRDMIYRRDDYTCQCCGKKGNGKLVAHHLDGYNWCIEKRLDINNGITLCDHCHLDFHHEYGWRNNTKEQWEEFYKEFLQEYFEITI